MTKRHPEATETAQLPVVVDTVVVHRVTRLSPSFVRVELGGDSLAELGVDGPWLDQRVKIVFPGPSGEPPDLAGAGADWWTAYCALPADHRGSMRTYTVRDVVGEGRDQRMVVDIVVHEAAAPGPGKGPGHEGFGGGPGNAWALAAIEGDRLLLVAPRQGFAFGGREFDHSGARRILLAADETAVPAVAGILRDLPAGACGAALLEVPVSADVQRLRAPDAMSIFWLPRDGAARGELLHSALVDQLGREPSGKPSADAGGAEEEVDPNLWETPLDAPRDAEPSTSFEHADELYAWVAGEAGVVTRLRRCLVGDHGLDRRQVAFMGYWREGVAMRA